MVITVESVSLKVKHHALETAWDRGQRTIENGLQGLVFTMDNPIKLAKQKLVKLVKCMNDGQSFLLHLTILLFCWTEGT